MGSSTKRLRYLYDSRGNRKALIDQDGGRFTYAYDAVNRITHLVNPQGDRTTYAYDPAGRRTVKKLANGTRASFAYDNVGNLTRLANLKSDGTTISSFNYEYDEVGNRTSVLEADGSRVTWSYDDTYQLTGEYRTGSHAYRNTFAYDPAGNRTLKNEDGARTTYSYDAANQLKKSVDASGTTTYTFDADGNQTGVEKPNGDRTTTSWDFENRTTLVQLPSGIRNTMAYEPGGLRVKLEESTGTKKFVWDEQNYLAETDENDNTQVVYTNEPRVYGNLVSQRRGSDSHWYHFDAIGSTRELTNDSEVVTDTRLYDAWGIIVAETGTTSTPFQYLARVGYYTDDDTAGAYVRFRHLLTWLGRWTSTDPLSLGAFISANYSYGDGNPISFIDPLGLWRVSGGPNSHADSVRGPCPLNKDLPTDERRSPYWHAGTGVFDLDPGDDRLVINQTGYNNAHFFQRVCVEVIISLGASDITTCTPCVPLNCDTVWLFYRGCFTESFAAERAVDNQSARINSTYINLLTSECNIVQNSCCAWSYTYAVVKEAWLGGARGRLSNRTTEVEVPEATVCCGGDCRDLASPPTPVGMPDLLDDRLAGTFKIISRDIAGKFGSSLILTVDHPECEDVTYEAEWEGYRRT